MVLWLKAMLKEWPLTLYTILSLVSTIATFSKPIVPGHVRALLALSTIVAFGAAAIRVDLKRQKRIAELEEKLGKQSHEKRKAALIIHPGTRSHYVAVRGRDQYPFPLKGLHIELDFSVENKGERTSSVNRYTLTLPDFAKSYPDIKPYFTQMVAGRNANYALNAQQFYPPGEFIRISAESVAGPALLAFFVSDLPLDSFGIKAFDGDRETRVFPAIRCELKLVDTEGSSANCEFALNELK